ncbi:MAG: GntR family transcriptional regulator [Clostridiales bacterium]|nr:GntR family transcriptional regulator [Clostridiales bacterium]
MNSCVRIRIEENGKEDLNGQMSNSVLDTLLEWIMIGKLKMGDKLNTEELASLLGVSRMPIREALKSLERKGLVRYVPYAGARLVKLTKDDVKQIYIMRQALEPIVGREACKKINRSELQNIEEIHRQYAELLMKPDSDAIEIYQQNRLYHFSIYRISSQYRICDIIESLWDTLSFFKLIYGQKLLDSQEARLRMIGEHESYLTALSHGDGAMFEWLMRQNLAKRIEDIPYKTDAYFE